MSRPVPPQSLAVSPPPRGPAALVVCPPAASCSNCTPPSPESQCLLTLPGVPNKGHRAWRETPTGLQHSHGNPKECRELQKVRPSAASAWKLRRTEKTTPASGITASRRHSETGLHHGLSWAGVCHQTWLLGPRTPKA